MQFVGTGCTAVLDKDHVEALVRQAAHSRRHALVGVDPGDDDVANAHVAQHQAQVRTRQGAVGGLGDDDLAGARSQFRNDLRCLGVRRHEKVVPAWHLLAQRAITAVFQKAGDASVHDVDALVAKALLKPLQVRDNDLAHPLVERVPAGLLDGRGFRCQTVVLHVDAQQSGFGGQQFKVFGLRCVLVIEGTVGVLPVHRDLGSSVVWCTECSWTSNVDHVARKLPAGHSRKKDLKWKRRRTVASREGREMTTVDVRVRQ